LEHRRTLCATVAGGCGQAEALEEQREMLLELAASLRELGQALCAIVAGGSGHAEVLAGLREVLLELGEPLRNLGQALCAAPL